MKLYAVALRDLAIGTFLMPSFAQHPAASIRSFNDECNRNAQDNMLYNHSSDFELWQVGVWDDQEGTLTTEHVRLARGSDVRQP